MERPRNPIPEFITRENIRRFTEQLASSTDDEQRQMLEHLLETEKKALRELGSG